MERSSFVVSNGMLTLRVFTFVISVSNVCDGATP